jgi:hypothetical protein
MVAFRLAVAFMQRFDVMIRSTPRQHHPVGAIAASGDSALRNPLTQRIGNFCARYVPEPLQAR